MLARERDLAAVRTRLRDWLARRQPAAEGLTLSTLKKPSAGVSNETLLFDTNWREAGRVREEHLVARLMPSASPIFPDYDLRKQYRIIEALGPTDVPVPEVLGYEDDESVLGSPFYVMRRIVGEIPSEIPPYHAFGHCVEILPERRARMWWAGIEALAHIHALDWERLGLGFLAVDQVEYYTRFLEWARGERPQPVLDAALAWLEKNRPPLRRPALCWGDSRLPNMIFRDQEVAGVLDWEMAFIGDPEADLAWWIFMDWSHSTGYGIPRLAGLPERDETIARYEELSGRKVEHFLYHEVLAAFRYGVITMRIARALTDAGIAVANDDMETNNSSTQRLAVLLDLPPPGRPARAVTQVDAITARIQFHLTGPGGSDWYLVSDHGRLARYEGRVEKPDTVLTVDAADWEAIQRGELNRADAFLGGKLKIEGDVTLLLQLEATIAELSR
jgi:aminoglycoside phosphotransferase (APT) family kinase protein/putative sterol carrier protein